MDHFVTLNKLPAGLVFPPDMREKIQYDEESHRLVYRGFMSKSEFDRLCSLSDDWSYRRPLEDLFRLCMTQPPRPKGLRGLLFRSHEPWLLIHQDGAQFSRTSS